VEVPLIAQAVSSVVAVVDPELIVLGRGIGQAPGFAKGGGGRARNAAALLRVSALGYDDVVDGCLVLGLEPAWQHLLDRS
jgi:hypothetical protein